MSAAASTATVAVETNTLSRSIRVMFVIPGDGRGSSMIFARRQAAALRARDVAVHEFFLRSRTSMVEIAREWRRFDRERRAFAPDVVHAHYGTVTAMFCALASGDRPVMITYRGSDLNPTPEEFSWRPMLAHLFSQLAALRAQQIVCVSRQLRERLWWRRSRSVVLASGVDAAAFRPASRTLARQALGWSQHAPTVLFHGGKGARVKRIDLAEAAIAVARRSIPDLAWKVVDGSVSPDAMPTWMNAADCLLVTSDFEGSPTVVQEALASNLPIVSVAVGDVPERLAGVKRTLIAPRDAEALGAALREMLASAARSDGRARIGELCSDQIAARLEAMYREMV